MLTSIQLTRYADVLMWGLQTARSQPYKKGDIILIRFHLAALRLAETLHEQILLAGMYPVLDLVSTPVMEKNLFQLGSKSQLTFVSQSEEHLYRTLNGSIFLYAPDSLTHLSAVDPQKIGQHARARKPLKDVLDQRDAQGLFGWTLALMPTKEQAHHAQTTLKAYSEQIVKACQLNRREPVRHWKSLHQSIQEIKTWLNAMPIKNLKIESDKIDLRISPGVQRQWLGLSGHNIPSFELFLSPDWRSTQGRYYANLPSYRSGNLASGIRLEFHKGQVSHVSAECGEPFVRQQLALDTGAGRVGEFSLTDRRFSKIDRFMANTLFDENHGGIHGNCHLAVGSSYADSYVGPVSELSKSRKKKLGFNESSLHWDLINTEKKRVTAELSDGHRTVIYENGHFLY